MGFVYTETFIWPTCPNRAPITSVIPADTRMEEILHNQQQFADQHDLPFLPIIPHIERSEPDLQKKDPVYQIQQTHYRLTWGVSLLAISFYARQSPPQDIFDNFSPASPLFGHAVAIKQQQCTQSLCSHCSKRNLKLILQTLRIQSTSSFDQFHQQYFTNQEPFTTRSFSRILHRKHQLILDKTGKNNRTRVYTVLQWTTISLLATQEFGSSLVLSMLRDIPTFRNEDTQETFDLTLDQFLRLFTTVYFWLHPEFLTSKLPSRLNFRTLELNSFLYTSRHMKQVLWNDFSPLLAELRVASPMVTTALYDLCMNLPNNQLQHFIEQLNVFDLQVPSYTQYRTNLTPEQQKILDAFARYITEAYHAKQYIPKEYIDRTTLTLSQIRKRSGQDSGSISKKIAKQVMSLVDRKILIQVEKPKTKAKYQYYLNPDFPYAQLLLSQFS